MGENGDIPRVFATLGVSVLYAGLGLEIPGIPLTTVTFGEFGRWHAAATISEGTRDRARQPLTPPHVCAQTSRVDSSGHRGHCMSQ